MTVTEIKAAVRERDGMRCIECGITAEEHIEQTGRTLDVHRIVPGSDYSLDGCVTLCIACHGPKPKSPYDPDRGNLFLRLPDPSLALALDAFAKRTRRSRNLAIVVLLEEAMKQAGLWPPRPDAAD